MKLPQPLSRFINKKNDTREYFFSLVPDVDAVSVSVWYMDHDHVPHTVSFANGPVLEDTWDSRIKMVDTLLSAAEDKAKIEKAVAKTVFGLPSIYLTNDGNIDPQVRPHLKKITQILELSAVGFVPIMQAFVHKTTSEEGVPASAIILGVSGNSVSLSLYRVGNLVHQETLSREDIVNALETSLKSQQDGGVLPSRILIIGGVGQQLETIRAKLLKHSWPTRTNFLHFPKIEVVTTENLLQAISLAGSAELASNLGEDEVPIGEEAEAATVVAQPTAHTTQTDEEIVETPEMQEPKEEDIANVEMVTPETLGFQSEDIHEDEALPKKKSFIPFDIGKKIAGVVSGLRIPTMRFPKGRLGFIVPIILILGLLFYIFYYQLPKATVTVLISPMSFDESQTITVDPKATSTDLSTSTIPGSTIEKSVSGEKTIAVTGKKKIGDPAKGMITLYNKVTSEKNLAKGAVVSAKGLSFTLDSSVSVASASESIGSITFGKADVSVTAAAIGAEGNLPQDTEFTVKDQASTSVSGRNAQAFSGGSSKDVTVVTRSDYDNLTKQLTDELIEKAQTELSTDTTSGRLIDGTITTKVTDKVFDEELDQEAKELHGNMTVTVSGITVADASVSELLKSIVTGKIPSGYTFDETQNNLKTDKTTVKKDGTITVDASFTAVAIPAIDSNALRDRLAGKKIDEAQAILKATNGIAGAEFRFVLSPTKSKLPHKSKNITITVAVQQ